MRLSIRCRGLHHLEVMNLYVSPVLLQVLKREPSMTVFRGRLATEQNSFPPESLLGQGSFNFSRADQ